MKTCLLVLLALLNAYCAVVLVVCARAVKTRLDSSAYGTPIAFKYGSRRKTSDTVDAWFASRCRNPDGTRNWSNT